MKRNKKLEVKRMTLACRSHDLDYDYYVAMCKSRNLKPLSKSAYENY